MSQKQNKKKVAETIFNLDTPTTYAISSIILLLKVVGMQLSVPFVLIFFFFFLLISSE